jgi:hypothetical protein
MSGSCTAHRYADANAVTTWDPVLFRRKHGIAEDVWLDNGNARYRAGREGVEDLRRIDVATVACLKTSSGVARSMPGSRSQGELSGAPSGRHHSPSSGPDEPIIVKARWHAHTGGDNEHEYDWDNPHVPGRKTDPGAHPHCDRAKYIFLKGEPIECVTLRAAVDASRPFFEQHEEQTKLEEALSEPIGGDVQGWWDRELLEGPLGFELAKRTSGVV